MRQAARRSALDAQAVLRKERAEAPDTCTAWVVSAVFNAFA
jgi:hypothetical protein